MFSRILNFLTEYSIPLLFGVILAILSANLLGEEFYHNYIHYPLFGPDFTVLGHPLTFHFIINDIFMVFFFGIATVEITQAVLPGGSLNPIRRAINPLFATFGGVFGPIAFYFGIAYFFEMNREVYNGWGIPTATDIALAWLIARIIFGAKHPAVSFLLLLAVADDAIGLGIIAIFYPDPVYPVEASWLVVSGIGIFFAFILNRFCVKNFFWYLLLGGVPSWLGLLLAHLHPALALVIIVPFMPTGHGRHKELFANEDENTTMTNFEHFFELPIGLGLFCFGLANAGVAFSGVSEVTWLVFFSLFLGKTFGVSLFSYFAHYLGISLPKGIDVKSLIIIGMISGIGLTVALFVAGEAFTQPIMQGGAKMGALFSAIIVLPVVIFSKIFKIQPIK